MKGIRKIITSASIFGGAWILFQIIASYYPEVLWFKSFGYEDVWWRELKLGLLTFSVFFGIAFVWMYFNLNYAKTTLKQEKKSNDTQFNTPFSAINQVFDQLKQSSNNQTMPQLPDTITRILTLVGSLVVAILMGLVAKGAWMDIYAYFNQQPFAINDPILNKNIGFYVFTLPAITFIKGWIQGLVVVTFVAVGWLYFTKGVFFNALNAGSSRVKKQLLVLLALFVFLIAVGKWIESHNILFSQTGVVQGAGYTDVNVILPYLKFMMIAFAIQAFITLFSAFGAPLRFLTSGLAVLFVASLIGGKAIPNAIQSFIVAPNEIEKEKEFIEHNIKFTRMAYNLHNIEAVEFPVEQNLTLNSLKKNETTLNNVRLWNKEPLKQTFSQLQEIRLYYEFLNVDVDRYTINNNLQQVMLSAREMDVSQLSAQAQTWINRHLVYTHGYGVCMSPVNEISKEGLPHFYIKDIPPVSTRFQASINRPEIYFGEKHNDYVIVNTKEQEFDYPKGDQNVYTSYQGKGGIQLDTFIKRLVYALKFSEVKILISPKISNKSRILYDKQISKIVRRITPFIIYDNDPYLVISDEGRLVWMLDGYTVSDKFPYSEPYTRTVNYIRNSVKVTIDAYNGETNFYIADPEDPVIKTYAKIYEDELFKPFDNMPQDLKRHIRYPKSLFKVQSKMYSTYHMTNPRVFYNREDLWGIPTETYEGSEQVMEPYYIVTKIPGDTEESFILMLPFTPTNKNNMIAWLSAKCDLDEYGKLKVFKFPKEKTIYGPMQIESRIDQDTSISQKLTLWGQVGSRVIRGNLMVIPIEESLIYVEPIYLQATQSKLPELKRVIFGYDDQIVMATTLYEGINEVFDGNLSQASTQPKSTKERIKKETKAVIEDVKQTFKKFKQALKTANWLKMGEHLNTLEEQLDDMTSKKESPKAED